jgi:glycosyltransferase involved in cell wall biosynthesis
MDNPLISIITTSYNQAIYLEKTILSVLNQTYKNVEYFVMDGGSTDGSLEIIKKYDSQLTFWQSKADKGQADAINQAFKMCKGEIIAFINSDDILLPWAAETAARCFEINANIGFIYGTCNTIDAEGNEIKSAEGAQIKFSWLLENGMLPKIYQPTCFFNVSHIQRDYFLDASLHYAFDYELLLFLQKNASCFFTNKHLASYRVHSLAKSQKTKEAYKEKLAVQLRYLGKPNRQWLFRKLKSLVK